MNKIITFTSARFQPTPDELNEDSDEYINPGLFGKQLSEYLIAELDNIGTKVTFCCAEDWGWYHEVEHEAPYQLGFGCQNDEPDSHLVQFMPKTPYARRWFKRYYAEPQVSKLRNQIMGILSSDKDISGVQLESG